MKGFVLNLEEGDLNIIDIYMKCDVLLSNRELVDRYNHEYENGYFEFQQLKLAMASLHRVFIFRFGKSPFVIHDKVAFEFTSLIFLMADSWEHFPSQN